MKYGIIGIVTLTIMALSFNTILACDWYEDHSETVCIDGLEYTKTWTEGWGKGPDGKKGTSDDVLEQTSEVTSTPTGNKCGQSVPDPIYRDKSECQGTTFVVWQEVSNDNGQTWSTVGGSEIRTENSADCGYVPPVTQTRDQSKCDGTTYVVWQEVSNDNGQTWTFVDGSEVRTENSADCGYVPPVVTPEPKGHFCTVCVKVIVNPQWVQCLVNRAADVESITLGNQTMVSGVDYRVMDWNNIQFADGDLMNALFNSGTVLKMVLINGEKIDLQVTPGVDHGYSNGCYIAWSSTWGDTVPEAGNMTFTDPTGKGPDCIDTVVWKKD